MKMIVSLLLLTFTLGAIGCNGDPKPTGTSPRPVPPGPNPTQVK